MKVLVTGANGLLGSNIIVELLKCGYDVRALVRRKDALIIPTQQRLEIHVGDINDLDALDIATKGCDFVIHAAAITDMSLLNYGDYYHVNVEGAINVLNASLKNNIKRFVFVGTANSFAIGNKINPGNEEVEISKPFKKSAYAMSKTEAQNLVLAYADSIDVIVVNPTFMLGSFDIKPSSGKIIEIALNKRFIFFPNGGKNFIHVADVAIGTINALEFGKNGQCYILANENLSYSDFYRKFMSVSHQKSILIKLPAFLLLFIGLIGSLTRAMGVKTSISYNNMKILCTKTFYTNEKAKNELNMQFKSTEKAIEDYLTFKRNRLL